MITGARPIGEGGWTRRKVAKLGLVLWVPFLAFIVLNFVAGGFFESMGLLDALFVVGVPLMFLGWAGGILLFVAWITPKGRSPFGAAIR